MFIQKNPNGLTFKVFVQPRSSKNMITGIHDDALKIKLTAPPVDGAANKMCIKYLAKCLNVPKSSLKIISGLTSRSKVILFKYDNLQNRESQWKKIKSSVESLFS